ncbi:MAG: hypothetical protein IPG90_02940 [Bacteroidetes bacterium]|nr:hypothetical protein [Bacteroidota bacterium]
MHRSRQYVWEVDDRLKQIKDLLQGTVQYGHDAFGNLTFATYNDGYTDYRIADEVGNLYKSKDKTDRKYGAAGQLLESKEAKYEYDPEGNLIRKTERDGKLWKYDWYLNGMLKSVTRPDKNIVSFTYDPVGRRLSKTFLDTTTRWVWDGNTPIHEWTEDSGKPTLSISADGNLAADIENKNLVTWIFQDGTFTPVAKLYRGQQYSIISDHLGTPAEMYNEKGDKVWEIGLNIYGEVRTIEGLRVECPFRFPGQYEDDETGLYYNRFRYYDPNNSIYISEDPIGIEGTNPTLYGYVHDTTITVDYFGLTCGPKSKKTSHTSRSRREAFRNAKTDAKIGRNQHPHKVEHVPLEDGYGDFVRDANGKPIQTREYHFTNSSGENVVIQEHSLGHTKGDVGPHFNVRPASDTKGGHIEGTHGHYFF